MLINYEKLIEQVGLFGQAYYYTLRENSDVIYVTTTPIEQFTRDTWNQAIIKVIDLVVEEIDPNAELSRIERIIYAYMKYKKISKATLAASLGMTQLELTNLITNHTLIKTKEFKTILKILDIKEEVLIR